jgi:hypothetical protein
MSNALTDFAALLGGEVEEVGNRNNSGASDFAPTLTASDFADQPLLAGRYKGQRTVDTANGERVVHDFVDASVGSDAKALNHVGDISAWGTTVLDDVLSEMGKDQKVLVVYEGRRETGRKAHIFRAYRAKGVQA